MLSETNISLRFGLFIFILTSIHPKYGDRKYDIGNLHKFYIHCFSTLCCIENQKTHQLSLRKTKNHNFCQIKMSFFGLIDKNCNFLSCTQHIQSSQFVSFKSDNNLFLSNEFCWARGKIITQPPHRTETRTTHSANSAKNVQKPQTLLFLMHIGL